MTISHVDSASVNCYALRQNSAGTATQLNVCSNSAGRLAVNGVDKIVWSAAELRSASDKLIRLGRDGFAWSQLYQGEDLIGETTEDADLGHRMDNDTLATSILQQWSPTYILEGQGWKTDATAASREVQFGMQVIPVEGTANPTGDLVFFQNINNAGFNGVWKMNSGGDFTPTTTNFSSIGNYDNSLKNIYASSTLFLSSVTSTMIEPWANNTSQLGAYGSAWNNIFVSSTAFLDFVSSTNADLSNYLIVSGHTTLGNASTTNITASGYLQVDGNTTLASATSTGSINIGNALGLNSEYFTDLTGVGLTLTSGALTVATSTFNLSPSSIDLTQGFTLVGDPSGNAQATSTLFLSQAGNVGIGTTSPRNQLTVQGYAEFNSTLLLTNQGSPQWIGLSDSSARLNFNYRKSILLNLY